eukprot:3811979-Pleurochrysis_carterae.AAC.1
MAPGAARGALTRQPEPAAATPARAKSLKDLPPGAVAKLATVKAELSAAGGRAAERCDRPAAA